MTIRNSIHFGIGFWSGILLTWFIITFMTQIPCVNKTIISKRDVLGKTYYTFFDLSGAWSPKDYKIGDNVCVRK